MNKEKATLAEKDFGEIPEMFLFFFILLAMGLFGKE